jgi:hypothetical protein
VSLILDALNRSRQDDSQVPGLATQHYGPADEDSDASWKRFVPWAALAVALLVIAWLVFNRPAESPSPVVETTPPNRAPAESPVPRPDTVAAAAVVADRSGRDELAVGGASAAVAPERKAPAPERERDPVQPAPRAEVTPRPEPTRTAEQPAAAEMPAPESAVADLYRDQARQVETAREAPPPRPVEPAPRPEPAEEPARAAPAASEEQPVDIEKLVVQAQDELRNARLKEHAAPFISSLSQQTKNDIPTIYYQRHDYSGRPGQSQVVLNGKPLKPGGTAAAGVRVKDILPDSVVLDYRGTEFRLRALNSWINL